MADSRELKAPVALCPGARLLGDGCLGGVVMQAWEYHVIYLDPDDFQHKQNGVPIATRALKRLGEERWEAVAVVDLDTSRKALLFKRPKSDCSSPNAAQAVQTLSGRVSALFERKPTNYLEPGAETSRG